MAIDLTGQQFGRLTVVAYVGSYKWDCVCICGNSKQVTGGNLKAGSVRSCGCLRLGNRYKYDLPGFYNSWRSLRTRIGLTCPSYHGKEYYSTKGISCDSRWLDFELFKDDMLKGWFPGAHLHRMDQFGPYNKSNCVWLEKGEHARLHNYSRSRRNGKDSKD